MNSNRARGVAAGLAGLAVRGLFALPDGLLRKLFGRPPAEAAGLLPDSWAMARLVGPLEDRRTDSDPERSRRVTDFLAGAASRPVAGVRSMDLALSDGRRGLDARIFTPEGCPEQGPLLVHFHGGGWVQGSIASHSGACAWLALQTGIRVLSVEYRLAPEHPFPAQADDALLAWRAVIRDPDRFGADPARRQTLASHRFSPRTFPVSLRPWSRSRSPIRSGMRAWLTESFWPRPECR